jgi:hypothetical protein
MSKAKKYQVLSPDGFTIEIDHWSYTSKKKMMEAYDRWAKRYEVQGYYSSSSYGRIPLNELINYCTFKTL